MNFNYLVATEQALDSAWPTTKSTRAILMWRRTYLPRDILGEKIVETDDNLYLTDAEQIGLLYNLSPKA